MAKIKITADFTAYPAGKKRKFTAGDELEVGRDIGKEAAGLYVEKGHAKEVADEKPAPPAPAKKKDGGE